MSGEKDKEMKKRIKGILHVFIISYIISLVFTLLIVFFLACITSKHITVGAFVRAIITYPLFLSLIFTVVFEIGELISLKVMPLIIDFILEKIKNIGIKIQGGRTDKPEIN